MGLHHDPMYYPDPERFDPERFSDKEKKKRPQYSYLPFGEGPRICIGEFCRLLICELTTHEFENLKYLFFGVRNGFSL
jgi:cytochrome P450 family 6